MDGGKFWRVSHPEHEAVIVEAVDRLRAVIAAAQSWGVRWTTVARECEAERAESPSAAAAVCAPPSVQVGKRRARQKRKAKGEKPVTRKRQMNFC